MEHRIWTSLLASVLVLTGCTSTTTSNTARTGTEQLLVSNAIDQSLNKVDFTPFAGRNIYLEEKYLDCVDKNYLIGSIRHRLLKNGAHLVASADKADIVLEPRSGGVGTHSAGMFIGVPEIVLPGMLTLPETRLIERKNQKGVAKIGLVAYDAKTSEALGHGGLALSESNDNNWFVLGIGPYQDGTIQDEISDSKKQRHVNRSSSTIPQTVAFSVPASPSASLHEPGQVRLASGEEKDPKVAPATKTTESPEWANQ